MANKLVALVSCLFLFAAVAVAGSVDSNAGAPAWIEVRQYMTMAIVAVVCIIAGVVLFVKTGHP